MVKYQPFHNKLVNHKIKKSQVLANSFAFTKKVILEMFIPAPLSILLLNLNKKWILLQLLQ